MTHGLKVFIQMVDGWNVKAHVMKQLEQFTYLVYGHIGNSYVNAVHVKLPHNMVGKDKSLFSSPESNCFAFPIPVCFGTTHPACDPSGCFVQVR